MNWLFAGANDWSTMLLALCGDLFVKTSLILGVTYLLIFFSRRSSAAYRHWIWCLAFISLLFLPLISVLLPEWQIPILPKSSVQEISIARISPDSNPVDANFMMKEGISPKPTLISQIEAVDGSVWIIALWATGSLLGILYYLLGVIHLQRLTRRAHLIEEGEWLELREMISQRLEITRVVPLLRSSVVRTPSTWGLVRPVVLIPGSSDDWSDSQREMVLMHEFAHIKRRDALTSFFCYLSCVLYWFNPLVWHAARQFRIERELACDDCVLNSGWKASSYAEILLEVARSLCSKQRESFAGVAMATQSQLEKRLNSILDMQCNRQILRARNMLGVGFMVTGLVLALAVVQLTTKQEAPPEPIKVAETKPDFSKSISSQNGKMEAPFPARRRIVVVAKDLPSRKIHMEAKLFRVQTIEQQEVSYLVGEQEIVANSGEETSMGISISKSFNEELGTKLRLQMTPVMQSTVVSLRGKLIKEDESPVTDTSIATVSSAKILENFSLEMADSKSFYTLGSFEEKNQKYILLMRSFEEIQKENSITNSEPTPPVPPRRRIIVPIRPV